MLTEKFITEFNEIKMFYESSALSAEEKNIRVLKRKSLVETALRNGEFTENEDIMFALWNISDCCAILRNGEELFENHKKLTALVNDMPQKFLFVPVSDATQKLTLTAYGKEDFWYDLYKLAVHKNAVITEENEVISFNSHRAAMYTTSAIETKKSHLDFAREAFAEFLNGTKNSPMYKFYKLIYMANVFFVYGEKQELSEQCEKLFHDLSGEDFLCPYLLGQWEQLSRKRSPKECASVGIKSAINAYLNNGEINEAKALYRKATEKGMTRNAYIEKRIL